MVVALCPAAGRVPVIHTHPGETRGESGWRQCRQHYFDKLIVTLQLVSSVPAADGEAGQDLCDREEHMKKRSKMVVASLVAALLLADCMLPANAAAKYVDRSGDLPGSGGPSTGTIVGVAVGVVVLAGAGVGIWLWRRHVNKEKDAALSLASPPPQMASRLRPMTVQGPDAENGAAIFGAQADILRW